MASSSSLFILVHFIPPFNGAAAANHSDIAAKIIRITHQTTAAIITNRHYFPERHRLDTTANFYPTALPHPTERRDPSGNPRHPVASLDDVSAAIFCADLRRVVVDCQQPPPCPTIEKALNIQSFFKN
jgi:hypothetical protein